MAEEKKEILGQTSNLCRNHYCTIRPETTSDIVNLSYKVIRNAECHGRAIQPSVTTCYTTPGFSYRFEVHNP